MLEERIEEIAELNERIASKRFRVLAGSEVNILTDGSLDYEDSLLERLDWVVASVHTSFRMTKREHDQRAWSLRSSTRWSTASATRPDACSCDATGYDFDVEAVIEAAASAGTMIEINGNPNRRDLSEQYARSRRGRRREDLPQHGRPPRQSTLANMRYGMANARRAWLTKADVANTRPWVRVQEAAKEVGPTPGGSVCRRPPSSAPGAINNGEGGRGQGGCCSCSRYPRPTAFTSALQGWSTFVPLSGTKDNHPRTKPARAQPTQRLRRRPGNRQPHTSLPSQTRPADRRLRRGPPGSLLS